MYSIPKLFSVYISIHAPRGRGDAARCSPHADCARFQSTPLSRGATFQEFSDTDRGFVFQSTPLSRGATARGRCLRQWENFNPRPSREGRLATVMSQERVIIFQSTPLSRGATVTAAIHAADLTFQSTPLSRGATAAASSACARILSFQSTPLSRGATAESIKVKGVMQFQSTPLSRGATALGLKPPVNR